VSISLVFKSTLNLIDARLQYPEDQGLIDQKRNGSNLHRKCLLMTLCESSDDLQSKYKRII